MPIRDITAIIINFRTPHLLRGAVGSLLAYYPTLSLILVDNGSHDNSRVEIRRLQVQYPSVRVLSLSTNIYHGPAVNRAISITTTPLFFLMDSDCTVLQGGFLEKMLSLFNDLRVYSAGLVRNVKTTGVSVTRDEQRRGIGIPYAETWGALYHKRKCARLGRFIKGGASAIRIATAAQKQDYKVARFPIDHYIEHLGAGTRRMFHGSAQPRRNQRASAWTPGTRGF